MLDDARVRLEQILPRQTRIVEFHFFGDLTFKKIAAFGTHRGQYLGARMESRAAMAA
jgi:hypothetical protein